MRGARFFLLAALAGTPFASCLDATEIDVALSSNVTPETLAQRGVIVQVGSPEDVDTSPTTSFTIYSESDAGDAGDMGDFVIVPKGSIDDHVAIRVVLGIGQSSESCAQGPIAPGSSCIESRRVIPFARHTTLRLPISLDLSCLGVTCAPNQTCDQGQCVGDAIDPSSCDGGTCEPASDAGPVPEASTSDACAGTMCNGECVDLATSAPNCGACGFDCTGGQCIGGVCLVEADVTGSCLASLGNSIFLTSPSGVYQVPKSGGKPVQFRPSTSTAMASLLGQDVAWFEPVVAGPYLYDYKLGPSTEAASSHADVMAMSPAGWAWADRAGRQLYFQKSGSVTPATPYLAGATTVTPNWVALTQGIVWGSMGGTQLCRYAQSSSGGAPTCLPNPSIPTFPSPGAVVAYDPALQSGVLVVLGSSFVAKVDDDMTKAAEVVGPSATPAPLTGAIALAGNPPSVYALAGSGKITEIDGGQLGTTFSKLVDTLDAVPSCIAADDTAVYWLEKGGGLYKFHR